MPPPLDLLPNLLKGLWITLQLTAAGSALAAVCAFTAGLSLVSRDVILRGLARAYVEGFRGTSALVQLFWFYFALPVLTGIRLPAMLVGILVLGLNIGAYGAEVVRGALRSVAKGQREAAVALSFSPWQQMRYVILPQALVAMLPPFANLLIELLKSTALVSTIAVMDLLKAGMFLRDHTHRTAEIFGLLLVIYFLLSLMITFGMRVLERRVSHGMDYGGVH